tara:strand:+ start:1280 stop:1591 length:312 start_codon:yes stop_codon:yes gene_type:complete
MMNQMSTYRFRTTLGCVDISFDPDDFEVVELEVKYWIDGAHRITQMINRKFKIESGEEFVSKLFDGRVSHILKTGEGLMWAIIELADNFYGSPEYTLEVKKDQ